MAGLLETWFRGAILNFVVIYAFAAPIGAVITFHLLLSPTHTRPRLLSALTAGILLTALLLV